MPMVACVHDQLRSPRGVKATHKRWLDFGSRYMVYGGGIFLLYLVGVVKFIVHKPCDYARLSHRLIPQEDLQRQIELLMSHALPALPS